MAEEKIWRDGVLGPLQLGAQYPEVGPNLGRLYDVRQVETGRAALMLLLSNRVEWRLDGPWQVRLSVDPVRSSVTLLVDRSPPSARVTELADTFVLMTAALQRVEGTAQVQVHLKSGVTEARVAQAARVHRAWRGLGGRALAGAAVLVMSLGLWLHRTRSEWLGPAAFDAPEPRASALVDVDPSDPALPAYPLPKTPFVDQAAAPCKRKGVAEINGGCWVELAQKPPCNDDEAEHQGKCYMPMSKKKRLPQVVQP